MRKSAARYLRRGPPHRRLLKLSLKLGDRVGNSCEKSDVGKRLSEANVLCFDGTLKPYGKLIWGVKAREWRLREEGLV